MDIDLTPYSMLLVNFSGGKDSSNILIETVKEARRQNVLHRVVAILSDTGAEWNSTADFSRSFCQRLGVPLQIVYPRCTIPDYLEARKRFPSMKCRWCTALKTSAIEKFISGKTKIQNSFHNRRTSRRKFTSRPTLRI